MEAMVYSLWFVPNEPAFHCLRTIIVTLAKEFRCPLFDPHVTLAWSEIPSRKEAIRRTKLVASAVTPLLIKLEDLVAEDSYFKSLYFRVTHTASLGAAYKKTRGTFDNPSAGPYQPHLSLMYGRAPKKAAMKLAKCLSPGVPLEFKASCLRLVRTTGRIESWAMVEDFSLNASGP